MKRRYVFAGFAVLAALVVASPAIGGPSLKKLVKKEVAKQLAGKTGPPGAAGAAGAAGANGTARAFAFVDRFDCQGPFPDDCGPLSPSKGVSSVTQTSAGVFCAVVPGLSPTTSPAVASVDSAESFPTDGSHSVLVDGLDSGSCTSGQYEFRVFDPDVASDSGLNLDTSFSFVIP